MATFDVILDNSPLGGTNANGQNAFVDAQGNGTDDIINVYVTPSYNGDISNFVDIWADPGDTINFIFDPAYRPAVNASENDAYVTITGSPVHYIDLNGSGAGGDPDGGLFTGTINFSSGTPPSLDYIVSGAAGDDVIDANYTDDPEGDMVDAADALDGSDDDVIEGNAGNDSISAGAGNDTVYGGGDNDTIDGGIGGDSIDGGSGNDTIHGGDSVSGPSLTGGSFEGANPTGPGQINLLSDWYQWNGGSADLNNDAGYEVPWVNQDATDGTNYITMGNIGSNIEGISQTLGDPLTSGSTATITFDASSGAWNGSSYSGSTSQVIQIWGNPNVGEIGANANVAPPNAVLLGTVTVDTTTMQSHSVDITPGFDMETISFSVANSGTSHMIYLDNLSMTGGTPAGGNDDTLTGGDGDDVFVYHAGDGNDVITDFGTGESGSINDGDQTNNDFVDLSGFYNATATNSVNNVDLIPSNDFVDALDMLRADAADGTIDGVIAGTDYSSVIGDINLTIENGGTSVSGTDLTYDNTNVTCFTRGTHILTPNGDVLVEDLRVGSRVETLDHGPQTVRWIGSTTRAATGACAPVRIRAGALDNDRDLWVSQQHRMVLRGAKAELMFGEHEVLVPAKSLVNDCSVRIVEGETVEYFHILFDTHEIIYAEGAMAESLHLGKQSFDALSNASIQEIKLLFPELEITRDSLPSTARPVLRNYEVQALLHTT